jgi:hypothetical protein
MLIMQPKLQRAENTSYLPVPFAGREASMNLHQHVTLLRVLLGGTPHSVGIPCEEREWGGGGGG